ncbi:hypothetical protein KFK09_021824 [Dendrobium nobile]|uniref:DUF7870 domain-containing protein n=1 Tax=Dendrobium nobile TaxID=94219 RepID=A0A8T3AH66_DENNO|nr:hypothetical protein KFK09_021824 [Dendrobium nobile]
MKASPRTIRRPNDGQAAAELPRDELVIPLPDPRLLRLIARSVLLAVAFLSLPWLRSALLSDPASEVAGQGGNSANDELFYMPKLLQDMKAYGLMQPQGRTLFLGNPGFHAALLRRSGVSCLPERKIHQINGAQSLDFVFLVAGGFNDANFRLIDPAIRVGGVAAFRLGTHPVKPFNLPANYRMIYIQNIGRTIIAVKKLYHDNAGGGKLGRRLLSVSETKEDALQSLEDALLEPPVLEKHRKIIRYLPDLTGESLDNYPRRVFVDIGSPGRVGSEGWFRKKYPGNQKFEIVRVDLVDWPAEAAVGGGDVGEWLRWNVRKEEYVVVKAEAEAVEEMVTGEVLELVDELFLECRNDWENGEEAEDDEGKWRMRAYWECLALFGKLRESGVAVHQWWG